MGIFVVFSLINFGALALAPASILTPLESIQFISNIAYHRLVNGATVSRRMKLGVTIAILGTVLSVVFGASGGGCSTIERNESLWRGADLALTSPPAPALARPGPRS